MHDCSLQLYHKKTIYIYLSSFCSSFLLETVQFLLNLNFNHIIQSKKYMKSSVFLCIILALTLSVNSLKIYGEGSFLAELSASITTFFSLSIDANVQAKLQAAAEAQFGGSVSGQASQQVEKEFYAKTKALLEADAKAKAEIEVAVKKSFEAYSRINAKARARALVLAAQAKAVQGLEGGKQKAEFYLNAAAQIISSARVDASASASASASGSAAAY